MNRELLLLRAIANRLYADAYRVQAAATRVDLEAERMAEKALAHASLGLSGVSLIPGIQERIERCERCAHDYDRMAADSEFAAAAAQQASP